MSARIKTLPFFIFITVSFFVCFNRSSDRKIKCVEEVKREFPFALQGRTGSAEKNDFVGVDESRRFAEPSLVVGIRHARQFYLKGPAFVVVFKQKIDFVLVAGPEIEGLESFSRIA